MAEPTANRYLADREWRALFDELRLALREASAMEPRLLDEALPEADWTRVWGEYSGLISRMSHLQQRLLARRIMLLDE